MSNNIEIVIEEVKVVKVKAKSFAQKDKKTMYSIMGFLLNLKEQGILDDEKVMECLEALPLYKTAAEKTAFFQQDMFDTKKVEDELYKPMVANYKKQKKENKQVKPRVKKVAVEGELKEKKPRVKKVAVDGEEKVKKVAIEGEGEEKEKEKKPRAKKVVVEGELKEKKPRVKKVAVEGEGEPKRGRKPKQQIVELAQEVSVAVEEEGLDVLIQSMNQKEETVSEPVPVELEDINVEDVENMLQELEAEDIIEPVRVSTPILKDKKKKDKEVQDKTPVVKKGKKNSVKIVE